MNRHFDVNEAACFILVQKFPQSYPQLMSMTLVQVITCTLAVEKQKKAGTEYRHQGERVLQLAQSIHFATEEIYSVKPP